MEKTAIELSAGVGSFRVGLNHVEKIDENGKAVENGNFRFLWANQGEPATTINFPKSIDHIVFVRGSGIDSSRKPCCIQGIRMYRQYIWVKGKYMVARLKDIDLI